ncbi:urease accessory protein UreF [Georgenia sunbinii]|uniref:urease accessory protein UreF n=1 Tax=Georgenia sunbinii TaxID=3117728 RepID=UPI002F26CEF3
MPGNLGALLLADARLPTGGHAYSGGLEPGLAAGMAPELVPDYITARARTVAVVEASAAVLAHRAVRHDPARLVAVHDALAVRTPSEPLREVSGMLGRGLVRMARRLWPEHPAVAQLRAIGRAPLRPVAMGVVAAIMGTDEAAVARASFYDDAQTVASATLKLAPVDPVDAVAWLLALEPLLDALVERVLAVGSPADMPALTAPQAEQWSLDHGAETRRIFVA